MLWLQHSLPQRPKKCLSRLRKRSSFNVLWANLFINIYCVVAVVTVCNEDFLRFCFQTNPYQSLYLLLGAFSPPAAIHGEPSAGKSLAYKFFLFFRVWNTVRWSMVIRETHKNLQHNVYFCIIRPYPGPVRVVLSELNCLALFGIIE